MVSKENKKINLRENMKKYFELIFMTKWKFGFLVLVVILLQLANLAQKYLFKFVMDGGEKFVAGSLIYSSFTRLLTLIAIVYISLSGFNSILNWIEIHLINRIESNSVFYLKKKYFEHVIGLSHRFHSNHKTGSLISKLSRGSGAIERITDYIIFNFLPLFIQIIITSLAIFYLDKMSVLVILGIIIAFVTFSLFMTRIQEEANVIANENEDVEKATISDYLSNVETIKYYGKEKFVKDNFNKIVSKTRDGFVKFWDYGRWFDFGQGIILGIGTVLIFYFPLKSFLNGQNTLGDIAFIYTAYIGLINPLYRFVHNIKGFYQAIIDSKGLFDYDKFNNEIQDLPNSKNLIVNSGRIDFENVEFRYHNRNIIKGINLSINPGEKVALVGHSGSGKTTIIKLLYRFYNLKSGVIKIDGNDVTQFKQESLRSELSIVPQEGILFDDTIFNNIKFSNPRASRKEVMNAIKLAQLGDFVNNLPDKENTIVGERGVKLSGGERQRVSIARALLANKKILVLDEATSALDSKTENEIQKGLEKLMKGRTSIIIAHRLSTIMNADKIVVLDKGKIVQIGKHSELINRSGVYKQLWELQKGGYIE